MSRSIKRNTKDQSSPRKGPVRKPNPALDKYAAHLERESYRARPEHKHTRYTRVEDRRAFQEGMDLAFGVRTLEDIQRRAGKRTRKVFK